MASEKALEQLLQSCTDITAPPGFAERVMARVDHENVPALSPSEARRLRLTVSGALCVASAFVLFAVLNTPLAGVIPQIVNVLKGVF